MRPLVTICDIKWGHLWHHVASIVKLGEVICGRSRMNGRGCKSVSQLVGWLQILLTWSFQGAIIPQKSRKNGGQDRLSCEFSPLRGRCRDGGLVFLLWHVGGHLTFRGGTPRCDYVINKSWFLAKLRLLKFVLVFHQFWSVVKIF